MVTKNNKAELKIYQQSQLKNSFLNDPKSDIFIILENRIFPLHKRIINECQYFRQNTLNQKVHFIKQPFDNKIFEKIVACLYGFKLQFVRNNQTTKILQIVIFLGIDKICTYLLQEFKNNFEEYGIFTLFNISKKFKIQWLQRKCMQEFVSCQFQQFHINKYDLLNNNQEIFRQVLKHHFILKSKGLAEGLQDQKIKYLIKQYSCINSTQIDANQIISMAGQGQARAKQVLGESFISCKNQINQIIRKRNSTWNCCSQNYKLALEYESKFQNKKKSNQHTKRNAFKKQLQVSQLKEQNKKILQRATKMIQQIKQVKIKLSQDCIHQQNTQLNKINKKLSQFRYLCSQQQQKIRSINKMVKQMKQKQVHISLFAKKY